MVVGLRHGCRQFVIKFGPFTTVYGQTSIALVDPIPRASRSSGSERCSVAFVEKIVRRGQRCLLGSGVMTIAHPLLALDDQLTMLPEDSVTSITSRSSLCLLLLPTLLFNGRV